VVAGVGRVAVTLHGLGGVAVDLDPAGLEQLQLRVLAAAEQDPGVRVWSTATSSRPSSGRASGITGSPPWSRPRLPISTPWPVRSIGGWSSSRSWNLVTRRRRCLNPLST
jgi:hypothetical protein